MRRNVLSLADACQLVHPNDTVVTAGFVGIAFPECLATGLEHRFLETSKPHNLTIVYGAGQGDGKNRGINHFGHEGMIKRVIGGHWGLVPAIGKLAIEEKIEAYNFPQGVIIHLLRDIAAGKPGTLTHVGLGTFIDPDNTGGKLNTKTTEDLIEKLELNGREWMFYKAFPIDIALVRGTTADQFGNITMEHEAMMGEVLAAAHAAHNSGGKVICQVERLSNESSPARNVAIPGNLVDAIVVSEPENHHQTFASQFNPAFSGQEPPTQAQPLPPLELDARKIIGRRAFLEIQSEEVVNLGIGIPETVARVASEEGLENDFTLSVESGLLGGTPAGGLDFGAAYYPLAMIDSASQFDFYDGGGLDASCLGAAQIDARGNVNVSRFGSRLPGVGGFVNISQNAKRVYFCGTFTAGGLQTEIQNGQLKIIQEGRTRKFTQAVEQISFSSDYALKKKQPVWFVTERAVFELTQAGLELIEVAPGIDVEKDILAQMEFMPVVKEFREMPACLFLSTKMGITKMKQKRS